MSLRTTRKPTVKAARSRTIKPTPQTTTRHDPVIITDPMIEALKRLLQQDQDAKQPGPEPTIHLNGGAIPKGAKSLVTPDRMPMLPLAINHLHGSLEHLSDTVRELEDKLGGVLMPVPEDKDDCGLCATEMAPTAVIGVRHAAQRVSSLTAQLSRIIERLEA